MLSLLPATLVKASTILKALAIVILVVDDWGYNNAGFTNGQSNCTPFLDALAANGTVLSQFYTHPTCTPSRAALMTSRYPSRYGMSHLMILRREDYGLPLTEVLWSEQLKAQGYHTALFGKWHLGGFEQAYTPHQRGFDHSVGFYGSSLGYYDHVELDGRDWFVNGQASFNNSDYGRYSSDVLVEALAEYLADLGDLAGLVGPVDRTGDPKGKPQPVFIYLPVQVAHQPMESPPLVNGKPEDGLCASLDGDYPSSRFIYNQMIRYLDRTVERVMTVLNQAGYNQANTLLAVVGDNGGIESFGGDNYPLRGHKGDSYDGGVRTPAFLWGKGVPKSQYDHIFGMVDVVPTLLEGVGWLERRGSETEVEPDFKPASIFASKLDLTIQLDGKSLWQGLQWDQSLRQEILLQLDWCNCTFDWTCSQPCLCPDKPSEFPNDLLQAGLRWLDWKLIYLGRRAELYNLAQDPGERNNLAGDDDTTQLVLALTQRLATYYTTAPPIAKPRCDPSQNPIKGWWLPRDYYG